MKVRYLLILLFALPVLGCVRKHRFTLDLGDDLYMEYFNINPAGVGEVYLTDSLNFRIYVGKYDTDHEKVGCDIKGDTIVVYKNTAAKGGARIIIDQKELSRTNLAKNKVHSTKPLFEFR